MERGITSWRRKVDTTKQAGRKLGGQTVGKAGKGDFGKKGKIGGLGENSVKLTQVTLEGGRRRAVS